MLKVKSENPNYLARIIRIGEVRAHPNANKLSLTTVQGQTIIVGIDAKPGDLFVLFQLGTKINPEFLSFVNGFSDPKLNRDKAKKGFFSKNSGRVKATRLRGILSEGYLHPLNDFNEFLKEKGFKFRADEKNLDQDFDVILEKKNEILFVEKFINPETARATARLQKSGGKVKKESRIIENQFRLSPDYRHLKREINSINPDDWIEISSKWHGANAVISKLLTKRKLNWLERLVKKLGVQIQETEYNILFSSRRVIKSEEFRDSPAGDFYGENVWASVAKKYQDCLSPGITCYGELVGYTSNGAGIQSMKGKVYDYGCEVGQCDFFVFRVTFTSPAGQVYEFSAQQMLDFCKKVGLKTVPFYFIGRAKEKYPELDTENHWHQNFLEKLISEYLEKNDVFCLTPGLADEGIVLSKRIGGFEGLKLKSQKFLLQEDEQIESGEANIEDEIQSEENSVNLT